MTIKEELALVRQAKRGEKDSLSKLWDDINPKLYGYLINVLKDREGADDTLQATWLKAIEKLNRFEDRGVRFSAWLFAIARNECKQLWRQNGMARLVNIEDKGSDTSLKTQEQMDNNLMIEEIFKKLTEEEQEILRLRFIGQLDFKEIAKVLEISVISARVRLHRILKKARGLV